MMSEITNLKPVRDSLFQLPKSMPYAYLLSVTEEIVLGTYAFRYLSFRGRL